MQIDAMENVDIIETLRLKFYNDNSSTMCKYLQQSVAKKKQNKTLLGEPGSNQRLPTGIRMLF